MKPIDDRTFLIIVGAIVIIGTAVAAFMLGGAVTAKVEEHVVL